MKYLIACVFIFGFLTCVHGQSKIAENDAEAIKQIVNGARTAIDPESKLKNFESTFIVAESLISIPKAATTLFSGNSQRIEEILISKPNKVRISEKQISPFETETITEWDGDEVSRSRVTVMPDGTRRISKEKSPAEKEKTRERLNALLKEKGLVEKTVDSRKEEDSKKKALDPRKARQHLMDSLIYPLLFLRPFEDGDFEFIGIAEVNGKNAYVISLKPSYGGEFQYVIEVDSFELIMAIENSIEGDIKREIKYFYTDRKDFEGVRIPTVIRIERTTIVPSKEPSKRFETVTIKDLKIS